MNQRSPWAAVRPRFGDKLSILRLCLFVQIMMLLGPKLRCAALSTTAKRNHKRIAVIGAGASGVFSAVSAAEHFAQLSSKMTDNNEKGATKLEVVVLEATSKTLAKVAISGGGRCNVLHDTSKSTSEILNGYPRGKKELTGLLSSRYTPQQAQAWFQKQGVTLKTEPDGRMFPITDSSQTVIDALLGAASTGNMVEIRTRQKVLDAELCVTNNSVIDDDEQSTNNAAPAMQFMISTQHKDKESGAVEVRKELFDGVILASGSAPAGYLLAQSILEQASEIEGAKKKKQKDIFVSPVPSLFTMNTKLDIKEEGCLLHGLAGVSVPKAHVTYRPEEQKEPTTTSTETEDGVLVPPPKKRKRPKKPPAHLQQNGPLLVSHHGVTGPAVLRLSAFGAREFHEANYRGTLRIHWAPDLGSVDDIAEALWKMTRANPKRMVVTGCPLSITALLKDSSAAVTDQAGDSAPAQIENGSMKPGFIKKRIAAVPKRLWSSLVTNACAIEPTTTWAEMTKKAVRKLATSMAECDLQVTGKGTFKEEFVKAGGVALKEIDMKTMMSKSCPGLFLCGEVINVDGVTGGFNFMNCWGTGHVAGTSAVDYVLGNNHEHR